MKLNEITRKLTIYEAFKAPWYPRLNEIFDTKFTNVTWNQDNKGAYGYAKLNDEEFKINLQAGEWEFNNVTYTFLNCSFEKIINGQPTTDMQYNSKNASAIIGAISNAIHQQLQKYEVDAFVFAATTHIQDRMRIYNTVAGTKKIPGFYTTITDVPTINGKMTVTINNKIPRDEIDQFIQYLKGIVK